MNRHELDAVHDLCAQLERERVYNAAKSEIILEAERDMAAAEEYAELISQEKTARATAQAEAAAAKAEAAASKAALAQAKEELAEERSHRDGLATQLTELRAELQSVRAGMEDIAKRPINVQAPQPVALPAPATPATEWRMLVGQRDGNGDIKEVMFTPRTVN